MADSKLTALTEVSVPALTDITYWVATPGGTPASDKITGNRLGGLLVPSICQGRLTTESGVPVSSSDRTAQGTIYWTPSTIDGSGLATGLAGFYDGTRYLVLSLSEISLALTVTSGKNYDVFLNYNSGTPALALSAAWTNDTTRADALATQGSIIVKSGTTTQRWIGTIRASGSNVTADSGGGTTTQVGGQRYVWNAYNQVRRNLTVIDTTNSWSYNTNTIRQADAASGNKIEYVSGAAAMAVQAYVVANAFVAGNVSIGARAGIGLDSTTTFAGLTGNIFAQGASGVAAVTGTIFSTYVGTPGLGYHYLSWNEAGADNTCVFTGDNGSDGSQSGLTAVIAN